MLVLFVKACDYETCSENTDDGMSDLLGLMSKLRLPLL
jgi:hypothetical protein